MGKKLYFLVLLIVAVSFIINIFVDNDSISAIINIIGLIVLVILAIYLRITLGRYSGK